MKFSILMVLQAVCPSAVAQVPEFGGVPVFNFEQSIFSSEDKKMEWVLMSKYYKHTDRVKSVCDDADDCLASGDPDAGGIGFTTVKATVAELKKLAGKHAEDLEFIEPAMPIQAWPIMGIGEHDYNIKNVSFLDKPVDSQPPEYKLWGLDRIDDEQGLDGDFSPPGGGEGVHVYVLDTGIKTQHVEFEGRAIPFCDTTRNRLEKCNPSDHTCSQDDEVGHGTHCAGTIGGTRVGVAKKTTLYSLKVLSKRGGSTAGITAAMDLVVREHKKPAIMSMSLGGPGQSMAFKTAIDKATAAGITVVVAAGNMNNNACSLSPAFVPNAITVGATGYSPMDARAVFSSYGPCLDIWGPGVDILSAVHNTNQAYAKMSGTSMACPHVSGAAALLLQKKPSMAPAQIAAKLKEDAIPDIVSDPQSGSPNLFLNIGSGSDGKPGNPGKPGKPKCPKECQCPSTRRRSGSGKGGKGGRRRRKN